MMLHKVFARHRLLKYNSEKSTAYYSCHKFVNPQKPNKERKLSARVVVHQRVVQHIPVLVIVLSVEHILYVLIGIEDPAQQCKLPIFSTVQK